MNELDPKATERVSGPSWDTLRPVFNEASLILLSLSPIVTSELTTIYVKFCPSPANKNVFAVVWIKSSKQIVIGLALPDDFNSPRLSTAPKGFAYKGLTKYLTVPAAGSLPSEFVEWARLAFSTASNRPV